MTATMTLERGKQKMNSTIHVAPCAIAAMAVWLAAAAGVRGQGTARLPQEDDTVGIPASILNRAEPPRVGTTASGYCRGKYLRTDAKVIARSKTMSCEIVIEKENFNQPAFRMTAMERHTVEETNVYEMLYRDFTPDDSGLNGSYSYTVVPASVWRDPPRQVVRNIIGAPLANCEVSVDAVPCMTDGDGVVRRPGGRLDLLADFDNLSMRMKNYTIAVKGYYPATFTVYRTMPQRRANDEKRLDEPPQQDLLVNYKLDFRPGNGKPEQDELECTLEIPDWSGVLASGVEIPVTVRVANRGRKATSCLLARTFSRIPGMNGRLFYFGAIPPGSSASFTRYIKPDADNLTSMAYAEIRFSDSWGIPVQKIEFKAPLVH